MCTAATCTSCEDGKGPSATANDTSCSACTANPAG